MLDVLMYDVFTIKMIRSNTYIILYTAYFITKYRLYMYINLVLYVYDSIVTAARSCVTSVVNLLSKCYLYNTSKVFELSRFFVYVMYLNIASYFL